MEAIKKYLIKSEQLLRKFVYLLPDINLCFTHTYKVLFIINIIISIIINTP